MRFGSGWALACIAVGLSACGAGENARADAWQVVRDTIGDTLVVRTVSGSVWGEPAELVPEVRIGAFDGEDVYLLGSVTGLAVAPDGSIYVYDSQVPALRKYAPDGSYVATFGREGGGPGEYKNSDGGLAVLADGRVVLRDPGNGRMQVYSAEGAPLDTWPTPGGFYTSQRVFVDTAGRIVSWARIDPGESFLERRNGLARFRPDGTPIDTIIAPEYDFEAARIRAERVSGESRSVAINNVPFTPTQEWTYSPLGYTVGGVSTRYAIDLFRPEGILRIERAYEPVPVLDGEKEDEERRRTAQMQQIDPSWKWNGPAIPDVKPPYRGFHVGEAGRIWVVLHQRAHEVDVEDTGADRPGRIPPARWTAPIVFDVFEPDGRYLGQVRAPDGFQLYPAPYFREDYVWAVVEDELEVEYVTRFRVAHEPAKLAQERSESRD